MEESRGGIKYFYHILEWQIIVCKECQHAVWPQEVPRHLQGKQHQVLLQAARAIAIEVQEWPGVIHNKTDLAIPLYIHGPIAELPLYTDGLQCRVEPERCS
ncbi:hypothetical protein BDY17DRAFT_155157 [Neohortaea acidophila]|uniref:Uncharacterized protein n=1 Tax=Neohortaea acidophila TaxID=245834 RepID=A0A6A6PQJ0_9PEZI|nr:uncharacterized protein BDY17DRAFT_155157 [Neohortaea acidophila]KAF2482205.1 hypothetical protein BDY17DRAFT_155157 [Neohortaea acidophila]